MPGSIQQSACSIFCAPTRVAPLIAVVFHLTSGSATSARQNLPGSQVRDSAGIRIVENARPADDSRLAWRIVPEPSLSIGEVAGEEAYMLHQANDGLVLPDGRIVIGNAGTNEIRVFDASGVHEASWGRAGEGPGEFTALAGVARWPTRAEVDEAIDDALERTNLEGEQLEWTREGYKAMPLVESFPAFRTLLTDGLDHLWVREATLPGMDRPAPLWTVFNPEGRVLGFIETPDGLTIGRPTIWGSSRCRSGRWTGRGVRRIDSASGGQRLGGAVQFEKGDRVHDRDAAE